MALGITWELVEFLLLETRLNPRSEYGSRSWNLQNLLFAFVAAETAEFHQVHGLVSEELEADAKTCVEHKPYYRRLRNFSLR